MNALSPHAAEIALLQLLVERAQTHKSVAQGDARIAGILDQLSQHAWTDTEHRIVYESLRRALLHSAVPLTLQMAAEATRMGHPDVDWPLYFGEAPSSAGLDSLLALLKVC